MQLTPHQQFVADRLSASDDMYFRRFEWLLEHFCIGTLVVLGIPCVIVISPLVLVGWIASRFWLRGDRD